MVRIRYSFTRLNIVCLVFVFLVNICLVFVAQTDFLPNRFLPLKLGK